VKWGGVMQGARRKRGGGRQRGVGDKGAIGH